MTALSALLFEAQAADAFQAYAEHHMAIDNRHDLRPQLLQQHAENDRRLIASPNAEHARQQAQSSVVSAEFLLQLRE